MIYSIENLSDKQIEELRQCPGVIITLDKHEAEVPMMAEGLFLSISNRITSVPITETKVPTTVERMCSECSFRAIPYINSSGKTILDKCNVHGERLKVTHAEIDTYSKEREMNMSCIT